MTNEEKTREIAGCAFCDYKQWCKGTSEDCCDEFKHIMAMAEWKEAVIIEGVITWLKESAPVLVEKEKERTGEINLKERNACQWCKNSRFYGGYEVGCGIGKYGECEDNGWKFFCLSENAKKNRNFVRKEEK